MSRKEQGAQITGLLGTASRWNISCECDNFGRARETIEWFSCNSCTASPIGIVVEEIIIDINVCIIESVVWQNKSEEPVSPLLCFKVFKNMDFFS